MSNYGSGSFVSNSANSACNCASVNVVEPIVIEVVNSGSSIGAKPLISGITPSAISLAGMPVDGFSYTPNAVMSDFSTAVAAVT